METQEALLAAGSTVNGSMVNESAAPLPVLYNLSWQAVIVIGIIAVVLGTIILVAILKGKAKKKAASPLFRAVIGTLLLLVFIIVTEGLGWYGPDGLPDWLKYGATIAMFFIFMMLFQSEEKMLQERIQKTYIEHIRSHVKEHFDAELNLGESSGNRLPNCRVLPNTGYGGGDADVVHYLAFTNQNRYVHYVFGLKSGIMLDWTEDPGPELISKVFKKQARPVILEQQGMMQDSVKRLEVPGEPAKTPA